MLKMQSATLLAGDREGAVLEMGGLSMLTLGIPLDSPGYPHQF